LWDDSNCAAYCIALKNRNPFEEPLIAYYDRRTYSRRITFLEWTGIIASGNWNKRGEVTYESIYLRPYRME
jgi:hypothetical protein